MNNAPTIQRKQQQQNQVNNQQQIVIVTPLFTLLNYSGRDFKKFETWVRQFESVSNANNWDCQRQREVLATCLNSYVLDEYYHLLNHYFQQVQGQSTPTISRVLNAINNRMRNFLDARSALAEWKKSAIGIRVYPRVLKASSHVWGADAHLDVAARNEANKYACMDRVLDSEIR